MYLYYCLVSMKLNAPEDAQRVKFCFAANETHSDRTSSKWHWLQLWIIHFGGRKQFILFKQHKGSTERAEHKDQLTFLLP